MVTYQQTTNSNSVYYWQIEEKVHQGPEILVLPGGIIVRKGERYVVRTQIFY